MTDDDAPLLDRRGSTRLLNDDEPVRKGSRFRLPSLRGPGFLQTVSNRFRKSGNDDTIKPPRDVLVGQYQSTKYPPNVISNAKYTPWSFLPRTLYNEFSFFFNIYFLLVALSQIIPVLRIGYMSSYIAPLAFVVSISLGKEALDDIGRRRRDAEANSEEFTVLSLDRANVLEVTKKSRDLKVGDVLKVRKNQRLPADVVILQSLSNDSNTQRLSSFDEDAPEVSTDLLESGQGPSESVADAPANAANDSSTSDTFIRTDQLDGETDWKLRIPSVLSQSIPFSEFTRLKITASPPDQRVNEFVGTIELGPPTGFYDAHYNKASASQPQGGQAANGDNENSNSAPLNIDNTAWANTVLASNTITYAAIIYTGSQTRAALSTSPSRSKVGLLEYEINNLTKILCALTLTLSVVLVALEGFEPTNDKVWYVAIMIYLILFSTIIPMSLRVNLDMAKSVYGRFIERDKDIPGTVVRTSTIPEDLGRIEYLLSDKTGTLTQNGKLLRQVYLMD
jgi:phospholipid-translocating ATPase